MSRFEAGPIERPHVFVTRPVPEVAYALLEPSCRVERQGEDRPASREEMLEAASKADALFTLVTDSIDSELLDAAPGLRVVANMAVGYDNVDVTAASERGVAVTNTPGVLTETTADFVFALMLASARKVVEADAWVRSGEWPGWGPLQMLGTDVSGATLGIVGLGRIGRAVARRASGFGMNVVYWNRSPVALSNDVMISSATALPLDDVLARADFVSVNVAYGADTHHLIGRAALARMKKSAHLINTARGAVIDEAALVAALRDGGIAGAGLDVFEKEPELADGLRELPQVVLAPHLGSASVATRDRMAEMAAENVLAACRGDRPPNLVNEA